MKDYSFLDDELLGGIRSLPQYYDYYQYCKYLPLSIKSLDFYGFHLYCISNIPKYLVSSQNHFFALIRKFGAQNFEVGCRAVHSAYMRTSRVKDRIMRMFAHYGTLFFLTLTYDDKLYELSDFDDFYKRAVTLCKTTSSHYILNSDVGDHGGRLHFHAVVSGDIDIHFDECWRIGFVNVQTITQTPTDIRRIARYVTKLARHACKSSSFKITYSRLKGI